MFQFGSLATEMLAPPRVPWFFQGSSTYRKAHHYRARAHDTRWNQTPKNPDDERPSYSPDDLAAKLGCREVFEDELEARLKVAEEMRLEEDGRLLEAVLSMRLEEFLNALSLSDLSMLSRVNRGCREGVSDLVGESRTRLSVRDYVVSKERLKWARENGCPWDKGVCSAAARGGHLEVLQYARANGCPWDEGT